MTTLADRLRAAIDETARIAQAAWQENWRWYAEDKTVMTHGQDGEWDGYRTTGTRADAEHIARHDPAAVLRRCAADRKILDLHRNDGGDCSTCRGEEFRDVAWDGEEETSTWVSPTIRFPCPTVLALAEAYGVEEQA